MSAARTTLNVRPSVTAGLSSVSSDARDQVDPVRGLASASAGSSTKMASGLNVSAHETATNRPERQVWRPVAT